MLFCTYAIALALTTTLANAQTYVTPALRRSPSCAMLDAGKIHCFGGLVGAGTTGRLDATLYTLDTEKVQSDYATHWEELKDSINSEIFTTYPRTRASVAVTSDKKNMIITGGSFGTISGTPVQNLVYNVDTKSWRALPNFDDGVNGNDRQIYVEATSWIPDQSKVYIFGGSQIKPANIWYYDNVLNRNLTNVIYSKDNSSSKIGYYRMTTMDIATNAASPWQVPAQQNPPVLSYYMQASVYHPTSKKIFYIGGLVNNATTEEVVGTRNVSMSEITTFDTVTGNWGTQIFTGDLIPSARKAHTVTLLPSGQDILMFGGTQNDDSYGVTDFCYTANLQTFVWMSCNTIALPNKEPPSRTEHSAVLDESKKIVYILFGYQELRSLANTFNTVLAINVTDSKSVSFIDTTQNLFTAAEQPTPATGDKETASQTPSLGNDDSSIVGGAVGGSLGGLLLIGILAFFIWRRKRGDKKRRLAKQRQEEEAEQLSVDWDAIEEGFTGSCPIPADEKSQHYAKPYDPSGHRENKQPLVMRNESDKSTAASLPVPDANANDVLIPDGGARSELMIKPDILGKQ
ncbi:hypothetical protein FB192DRAFT_1379124 [Mucor lusitanicus]|uniref:Galactose oxidase n=1 Tax=Mucor circinelloides f. lusitanicus TaxID=29924 RepID=A0A8H4BIB4_MUCCL|nr:hypothetical protein FB192DRAFT_1379124 [Mucor lusitanicus]